MRRGMAVNSLKIFLDELQARYNRKQYLSSDPVEFPHRYQDPWDQEAVSLVAALLAYGKVKQIRQSVAEVLRRIHQTCPEGPARFVRLLHSSSKRQRQRSADALNGFVHRFNVGSDLVILLSLLGRSWREYGSLGGHFVRFLKPEDPDITSALNRLIFEWRDWAKPEYKTSSFSYLLTAPQDGSCCKRWCMFLRWMGRKDSIDLGLWTKSGGFAQALTHKNFSRNRWLRPDQLVIPLDTHTGRISQYLGLTSRKSLNWLAAQEVTKALRLCNPGDPTRYDFAISRLGILDLCQKRFRVEICQNCSLLPTCRYAQRGLETPEMMR
jgi:uncharacterized protein (TIGR02757 family)